MAIEEVLSRISSIQARFGVGGGAVGSSEFEGVLSDAARHAGISPTDRVDETTDAVATAGTTEADTPSAGTASTDTPSAGTASTDTATVDTAEPAAPQVTAPAGSVVSILDELGVSTDVASGEALEALSAATAPALTTAAALGATGSTSLLDALNDELGAEAGQAMMATIIAQQQAGAGILRATNP